MSEAQLIGRGARYFPFDTNEVIGEDRYKRKFDGTNSQERLYYYDINSSYPSSMIKMMPYKYIASFDKENHSAKIFHAENFVHQISNQMHILIGNLHEDRA